VDASSGVISTVAGNGDALYEGDGVQATTTGVVSPAGVTFDRAGNLYISESDRIRKVNTSGIISTLAGAASAVQTPDSPATAVPPLRLCSAVRSVWWWIRPGTSTSLTIRT
jgi:hypothetical protein